MTETSKARLALAAVCLFWGTGYLAIRVAVRELPAASFCAMRFFLAGGALLFYALWKGHSLPRGRDWLNLAMTGTLLLAVSNGILSWSLKRVPSELAALIAAATPLWMAVFARLSGEIVRPRAVAGLLAGLGGLAILLWPDLQRVRPEEGFLQGLLLLLAGGPLWAFGSIFSKKRPPRTAPVMSVATQMLVACAIYATVALAAHQQAFWHPSLKTFLAVFYLAAFCSILGYGSYMYALSKLPTVQVSIYAYVNPIVAVILGVLLLGERFDAFLMVGIPVMLSGVYLVNSAHA